MREHLANHTFGFYLSISAGILSVVSLLFYLGADNQGAAVLPLIVCSILAEVAGIAIKQIYRQSRSAYADTNCECIAFFGGYYFKYHSAG